MPANKTVQILSANMLEDWEQCQRRAVWHREWELGRVTPYQAIVNALHGAILNNKTDADTSASMAVMTQAANRGVWTERPDPYAIMVHHAALAQILFAAIYKNLLSKDWYWTGMDAEYGDRFNWQCSCFIDNEGKRLKRLVLVDRWDEDRQLRELHSWRTVGDVCVTGLPMDLVIMVIGQSRDGRRHGPWTKGWQHPVNHSLKFKRTHQGKKVPLVGGWRPVWRENASEITTEQWLKQMEGDGVLRDVMLVRKVKVPEPEQRKRVLADIERLAEVMEDKPGSDGLLLPMTRSACDFPRPCPFQNCCFAPMGIGPGDVNLFRRRS